MPKYINNTRGKSDKHQDHERKYAASHQQATLERWYEKMTKPRNPVGRPRKVKEEIKKKIAKTLRDKLPAALKRYQHYSEQFEDATDPAEIKKWEAYKYLVARDHPQVVEMVAMGGEDHDVC